MGAFDQNSKCSVHCIWSIGSTADAFCFHRAQSRSSAGFTTAPTGPPNLSILACAGTSFCLLVGLYNLPKCPRSLHRVLEKSPDALRAFALHLSFPQRVHNSAFRGIFEIVKIEAFFSRGSVFQWPHVRDLGRETVSHIHVDPQTFCEHFGRPGRTLCSVPAE